MATTDASDGDGDSEGRASGALSDAVRDVCACRTSPDRTVFTENGHADAWIATDHTVSVER